MKTVKMGEMTVNELNKEIAKSIKEKIDPTPLYVEIYKKMNMSIASFVLIFMGIPLGIRAHRSEKSIGFGLSLVFFALYWGLFLGGIAMALKGSVPPLIGVSLPNVLFFIFGVISFILTVRK